MKRAHLLAFLAVALIAAGSALVIASFEPKPVGQTVLQAQERAV